MAPEESKSLDQENGAETARSRKVFFAPALETPESLCETARVMVSPNFQNGESVKVAE